MLAMVINTVLDYFTSVSRTCCSLLHPQPLVIHRDSCSGLQQVYPSSKLKFFSMGFTEAGTDARLLDEEDVESVGESLADIGRHH